MSRESLAHALSGPVSLAEDQWRERDVDRIHAAAAARNPAVLAWLRCHGDIEAAKALSLLSSLGIDLVAYKMGQAETYRERCMKGLVQALEWPENRLDLRPASSQMVAAQALMEWMADKCITCHGRTTIPDVDRMAGQSNVEGAVPTKECPSCRGTGIRLYSDDERAQTLGGRPQRLTRALETAHSLIGEALKESARNYYRLSTK